MDNKKKLIAASIPFVFSCAAAHATGFSEEQWKAVKSYANVTIAEDSVSSWGPWNEFAEPAAGPVAPVAALTGSGQSDVYRNRPDTITQPTSSGCAAGSWCGYALYTSKTNGYWNESPRNESPRNEGPRPATPVAQGYQTGLVELTLSPNGPISGLTSGSMSWTLTTTSGDQVASSGNLSADFGGGVFSPPEPKFKTVYVYDAAAKKIVPKPVPDGMTLEGAKYDNRDDSAHHFTAGAELENGYATASGFSHNAGATEATDAIKDNVLKAPFTEAVRQADNQVAIGKLYAYTYGNNEVGTSTSGYYVAGVATPQAYLNSQKAGQVTATYSGGSYDGARQGTVSMTVNFGKATWSGSWSNGTDSSAMNFNASGTISGANIASNSVTAGDNNLSGVSYSGSVTGTFYGQSAASIGGTSNVQKSVNSQVIQTQNAIFLVNKQ